MKCIAKRVTITFLIVLGLLQIHYISAMILKRQSNTSIAALKKKLLEELSEKQEDDETGYAKLVCKLCKKDFLNNQMFGCHMRKQHSEYLPKVEKWRCTSCKPHQTFLGFKLLKRHHRRSKHVGKKRVINESEDEFERMQSILESSDASDSISINSPASPENTQEISLSEFFPQSVRESLSATSLKHSWDTWEIKDHLLDYN